MDTYIPHDSWVSVSLNCAAGITPKPVDWLWPGFLPAGMLTILAGAAGTGKTTLAMEIAAIVSRGGDWPDGSRCDEPGDVVIWTGEDDIARTLVPRLMAAGADLIRVHFIGNTYVGRRPLPFDPSSDIESLLTEIRAIGGAKLIILDPIISAIAGDAHRANEVRRGLQDVLRLCDPGTAILGITHFSKGTSGRAPLERVIGSQAFGAVARVVLVAGKENNSDNRVFARAKSNIGPDDGGFSYQLVQKDLNDEITATKVEWGEELEGDALEILSAAEQDTDERSELEGAKVLMKDLLADGPISSKQAEADCKGAGYSAATIRRARKSLGVDCRKDGKNSGWRWHLP